MPFEIILRYTPPFNAYTDPDEALQEFLRLIGYLREEDATRDSVAYRLVRECFTKNSGRAWTIEEMTAVLGTTKPTLYRHLNRLKALDVLEEAPLDKEVGKARKGYRLRYGNLARAWDFTEANIGNALKRYREAVDHIQGLLDTPPSTSGKK
jgi:predicted ArsR family transcriptional regulator